MPVQTQFWIQEQFNITLAKHDSSIQAIHRRVLPSLCDTHPHLLLQKQGKVDRFPRRAWVDQLKVESPEQLLKFN